MTDRRNQRPGRLDGLAPPSGHGRPVLDLTGQRFGRLVAVACLGVLSGHAVFRCECDCGGGLDARSQGLRRGRTTHCGCSHANATHRQTETITYSSYSNMLKRCHNPSSDRYPYWGARGIEACSRWRFGEFGLSGFECFLADVGERPSRKHTIERNDNDGNYEPGNCRWATMAEQALNRRPQTRKTA